MNRSDQQMVSKILGIVHEDKELAGSSGTIREVAHDEFIESVVVDFDLQRRKPINLPASVDYLRAEIECHLRETTAADPWGFIDERLVVIKLEDQPLGESGKLMLFSIQYVTRLLEKLFPNASITASEKRILLQTLSGYSLREAAEQDQVSYETKKTQLKAIYRKTHLNKQQVLSNFLIAHLTLEHAADQSRTLTDTESDSMFFHYVDNYMGPYVRASVVQESPERRFRVIELGDPAGTPVVCVHHLGVINFSEQEIDDFRRNGLRLICPLRYGALGPSDKKLSSVDYLEHALAGIDLAVSLTGSVRPVVLSLLSGCMYALKYCKKYPGKTDKLIMFSANYRPPVDVKSVSTVKENLHGLAVAYENTLEKTVTTMLQSVPRAASLRQVMLETHNHGAADVQTIDELFSDEDQVSAMQHRLSNSPLSIVEDLKTQAARDWSPLDQVARVTKIHFIHGSDDNLIPVENVSELVSSNANMDLHVVEGAGNWIFGRYTAQTAALVQDIVGDGS